jgi:hypothetical protein
MWFFQFPARPLRWMVKLMLESGFVAVKPSLLAANHARQVAYGWATVWSL